MEIISPIFETIGQVINKFADCVSNVFESVVGLFYVAPVTEGSSTTPGHLSVLGVLLLIAVGTGLVMWAFRTIRGLIKRA